MTSNGSKAMPEIPIDLRDDYRIACNQHLGHRGFVKGLIERIAKAESELAVAEFRGWNNALEAAAEIASNVGPFSSPGMIRELVVDAEYRGLS
jgi:hypothetical protein